MLVVRNVLRGGRQHGVHTALGICTGTMIHAAASALGIAVILATSSRAYNMVKLAGAVYLIWLGVRSIRDAVAGEGVEADEAHKAARAGSATRPVDRRRSLRSSFIQNVFNNLLYPKAAIFHLAVLPQFISVGHLLGLGGYVAFTDDLAGRVNCVLPADAEGAVRAADGHSLRERRVAVHAFGIQKVDGCHARPFLLLRCACRFGRRRPGRSSGLFTCKRAFPVIP